MQYLSETNRHTRYERSTAFTLVELMVSILFISTFAVVIGMAMFQSQKQTIQIRQTFTNTQRQNQFLKTLDDELRWATKINALNASAFSFDTFNPATNTTETITYTWNLGINTVYRKVNSEETTILSSNVTELNMAVPEYEVVDGETRLCKFSISIKYGNNTDSVVRIINLINKPAI